MRLSNRELWQIAQGRASKDMPYKESIRDSLFIYVMFFDITLALLGLPITEFFPDIAGWLWGAIVCILVLSMIPISISMFTSQRNNIEYYDRLRKKTKEIFEALKEEREA